MEIDASTTPPKPPRLPVEHDVLSSQVLEILGGTTLEALQKLEEPEERDVWSMEEGDDSVFYSDEEQPHEDIQANTSCGIASESKQVVNSVADELIPQREESPAEESIVSRENWEMEKEMTPQVSLTGEKDKELRSDHADQKTESDQNSETFESSCEDSQQPNCTIADMQTQPEVKMSAEKENLPVEKEVVLNAQTANLEPSDVTYETNKKLNGETQVPEQMSRAEVPLLSDTQQIQIEQRPEKDLNFHVPVGFHQNPNPGHASLPHPKKTGQQKSFDHLTSTKYSTVSYRRIRKGNTRKKIEEFEYMMMNL
ncbi:uncharacterized protein ermn [Tautogolabrus adspersus]